MKSFWDRYKEFELRESRWVNGRVFHYYHGAPCWFCGAPVLSPSCSGSFMCGPCDMGKRDTDAAPLRYKRSREVQRLWTALRATKPPRGVLFIMPSYEDRPCVKCKKPSILRREGGGMFAPPITYCLKCDPFAWTDKVSPDDKRLAKRTAMDIALDNFRKHVERKKVVAI